MAQNLLVEYPGRVTAADADYTYGSSKNETIAGVTGDGTPNEKERADDIIGFQQALLRSASIVPSESPDTQLVSEYMQAIIELAQGRAKYYNDVGVADAYVLNSQSGQQGPRSYFDGQEFNFTPGNVNTGPSNIRFDTLPVIDIFLYGEALNGGELDTGFNTKLVYSLANDRVDLILPLSTPSVLVRPSASIVIPDSTLTTLIFDVEEDKDITIMHNNATNNSRLVVPPGARKVSMTANVLFELNGIGLRTVRIDKNGSSIYPGHVTTTTNTSSLGARVENLSSHILKVVPGDYFEVSVFQTSGGNLNVEGGSTTPTSFSLKVEEYL